MPPIKIYTDSPINPASASSTTPKASDSQSGSGVPSLILPPRTTTSPETPTRTLPSQSTSEGYTPPPQPGAIPNLPQQTPSAQIPRPPRAGEVARQRAQAGPASPTPTTAPAPGLGPRSAPLTTGSSYGNGPRVPGGYRYPLNTAAPQNASGYYSNYRSAQYQPPQEDEWQDDEESVLDSVIKFAKVVGEKLSEAESEVWRRINGDN